MSTEVNGGFSILGVLQIAFIVMKAAGVIAWSWWLVFIPVYIWFAAVFLLLGAIWAWAMVTIWITRR